MTEPEKTQPVVPAADPVDLTWQIEDDNPEEQAGGEVEYDFDAPDPEDG